MLSTLMKLERRFKAVARQQLDRYRVSGYLRSDRRPWRSGYSEYRDRYLQHVLNDSALMKTFRLGRQLPSGFGFRLDERVIEIPWALARLEGHRGRLLDAGSSLNHEFVLRAPAVALMKKTIVTLSPESAAYWKLGVSYMFGDLRNLDFRDDWFDAITCISTIEHVGMDNAMYTKSSSVTDCKDTRDYLRAVSEIKRTLKPGAPLYITFPFGRYANHGFFQQFDAALIDELIVGFAPAHVSETIYRYTAEGWRLSDRVESAECEYFNIHKSKYFDATSTIEYPADYTAGVRAVACLELRK